MRAAGVASRVGKPHAHSTHSDTNHGDTNRDRHDVDQHRRGHHLRPQRDWRQRQASGNAQRSSSDESNSVRDDPEASANPQPGRLKDAYTDANTDANTDGDPQYPDGQPIAVINSDEVYQGRAIG